MITGRQRELAKVSKDGLSGAKKVARCYIPNILSSSRLSRHARQ